jgi:hypothetical protein
MEWILEVAGALVSSVVGVLVIWYLTKGADHIVHNELNRTELRMNKLYLTCGIIGVVVGLVSVSLLFISEFHNQRTFLIVLTLLNSLIFLCAGVPCLMYYRNHRVIFTDSDFLVIDVWGEPFDVPWDDVTGVEFNKWTGLYSLQTRNNKVVKLHSHLVGANMFLRLVAERSNLR